MTRSFTPRLAPGLLCQREATCLHPCYSRAALQTSPLPVAHRQQRDAVSPGTSPASAGLLLPKTSLQRRAMKLWGKEAAGRDLYPSWPQQLCWMCLRSCCLAETLATSRPCYSHISPSGHAARTGGSAGAWGWRSPLPPPGSASQFAPSAPLHRCDLSAGRGVSSLVPLFPRGYCSGAAADSAMPAGGRSPRSPCTILAAPQARPRGSNAPSLLTRGERCTRLA